MTTRSIAVVALLLCSASLAQERIEPLPPELRLAQKDLKPLVLEKAQIHVVVTGQIAQTTMTLTFRNENSRVLEGELVFPLPENAAVSGYGLDVNGEMVDGVPVEKTKARVVFETEVRKGVDPGLVEHVKGNNFRTRIYPIPANGVRTVKVSYVSDLLTVGGQSAYSIPLNWGKQIAEGSIRIEVVQAPGEPQLQGRVLDRFAFEKQGDRWIAERKFSKVSFDSGLAVVLPEATREHVVVEKWEAEDGSSAGHFFMASDRPLIPVRRVDRAMPGRIAILWDASLSRADADKQREMTLVQKVAAGLNGTSVDLIVFRNTVNAPVTVKIEKGDASKLIERIKAVTYDGATDLGQLACGKEYAYALLFTDGLGNLGDDLKAQLECPVYCVSADVRANHGLLRYLAQSTGGQYLNLARITDDQAAAAIGDSAFALVSAEYNKDEIADVYPRPGTPVSGKLTVTGKLLKDKATIKLNYGFGSRVAHTTTLTLSRDGATATGLVARFWAQQKAADLSVFAERHEKELAEIGRMYGIVTPNTSLMVLETLEQYLTHHITPPRSRKAVYEQYMAAVEKEQREVAKVEAAKIDRVLAMWQARVKWWETKFEYAKDFKYVAKKEDRPSPAATVGEAISGGVPSAVAPRPHGPADPMTPPAQVPAERRPEGQPILVVSDGADRSWGHDGETGKNGGRGSAATIKIKPWNPDTPYLKAMKSAGAQEAYAVYLAQRKDFASSPAFYLDCGDWLLKNERSDEALRVLSNIVELQLDSAPLLRIAAHKLAQAGQFDAAIDLFEKVVKLRPEEPQSFRDLALVLAERAEKSKSTEDSLRALELLHKVVMNQWQRFEEVEVVALMEANRIIARLPSGTRTPFDARLVKNLDLDVRIVMTWDADMTDIDLHVTEPSGEKCDYSHNRTTIGGLVSRDFTQGYGPEEYCLRKMMPGTYKIQCHFFGSNQQTVSGPCTVQATVITDFGRPTEKRQSLTLRLTDKKEMVDIGEVTLGK